MGNGIALRRQPIWREHLNTLLKRRAPSVSKLVHAQQPTDTKISEEATTESEILVCTHKMKNGKAGGDDGISAEVLISLHPSGIREMTKINHSIWNDERQEVIRHGIQQVLRNITADCNVQGVRANHAGSANQSPRGN
ncbi:hypothetical protein RB195_021971 [Necator americanus]